MIVETKYLEYAIYKLDDYYFSYSTELYQESSELATDAVRGLPKHFQFNEKDIHYLNMRSNLYNYFVKMNMLRQKSFNLTELELWRERVIIEAKVAQSGVEEELVEVLDI